MVYGYDVFIFCSVVLIAFCEHGSHVTTVFDMLPFFSHLKLLIATGMYR